MDGRIDNRVVYVDPTNLNGSTGREYVSPMEDYTMFVDLKIIKTNRFGCGKEESSEVTEFSSQNGSISFMEGTNGNLTTNFTDISYVNPDENTKECLGIQSITIDYSSMYVPQITIVFTDVRGASLMSQSEGYHNGTAKQPSFFNDLFSFPYPMFELTVKGYYGNCIKYNLALMTTNLQFNAETGNFDVRANFVGYMYGALRDVPMQFLAIAPYVNYNGKNYWDEKVSSGDYVFDEDGAPVPMCTFLKLRLKLAKLALTEEYQNFAREHNEKEQAATVESSAIRWLQNNFPCKNFVEPENEKYFFKVLDEKEEKWAHKGSFDEVEEETAESESQKARRMNILDYINAFNDYKKNYDTSLDYDVDFLKTIYILKRTVKEKKIKGSKEKKKVYTWSGEKIKYTVADEGYNDISGKRYESFYPVSSNLSDAEVDEIRNKEEIRKYIEKTQDDKQKLFLAFYEKDSDHMYNNLADLNERIDEISNQKAEETEDYNKALNAILAKALGFTPSIKNFYELAFAHMDAFCNLFYAMLEKIGGELNNTGVSDRENRKLSTYSIPIEDTDLYKTMEEDLMAPFTGIFEEKEEAGQIKREMIWPGNLTGGDKIEEVNFIESFLAGAKLYNDDVKRLEEALKNPNYNIAVDISNFIPTTLYDIAHIEQDMPNPYEGLVELSNGGDCSGDILAMFMNRTFSYLFFGKDDPSSEGNTIGVLEAINFYKAYRDKVYGNFVDFYIQYIENPKQGAKRALQELKNKSSEWNFSSDSLLTAVGAADRYTWIKDKNGNTRLPVFNGNNLAIKNDYSNGTVTDSRYVNLTNPISGNVDTCVLLKERKDLESLMENISNQMGEFEDIDVHREKWVKRAFKDNINYTVKNLYDTAAFRTLTEVEKRAGEDKDNEAPRRKAIKNAVENNDFSEIYIKHPTSVNNDWGISVHGHAIYWLQDNIANKTDRLKAKAFLFLMGIPIKGNILDTYSTNGAQLKLRLLKEGAIYWREKNMIESNTDGIVVSGTVNGTYFGERINNTYKYARPKVDELYIKPMDLSGAKTLDVRGLKDKETGKNYKDYSNPNLLPATRKNFLMQMFEEWATGDYNELDTLLKDSECHKMDNKEVGHDYIRNIPLDYENGYYGGDTANSSSVTKNSRLQTLLRNLFFDVDILIDYSQIPYRLGVVSSNVTSAMISETAARSALESFFTQLKKLYKDKIDGTTEVTNNEELGADFNSDDLKLSLYITMKSLYERWFCSTSKEKYAFHRGITNSLKDNFVTRKSIFDRFMYIDVFFHNIGDRMMVNLMKADEMLGQCIPSSDMDVDKNTSQSVQNYLVKVADQCGANLLSLPIFYGTSSQERFEKMFSASEKINTDAIDTSTFVVLYKYRTSNHLNNGIDFRDDSFVFDGETMIPSLCDGGDNIIPAFAVTYAKQNQSFFKSISLNTNQPPVSDYSIEAEMKIASKESETPRETNLVGQDIYQIYSQAAYECTVEMMGNAQIFPCMYFQLNGIPLWRGAYYITKVIHEITAGNMVTRFTGVRMSKNSLPMAEMESSTDKNTGLSTDSGPYTSTLPGGTDFGTEATAKFKKVLQKVLYWEGGYKANDKDDNDCGCTNRGITLCTFRYYFGQDKTCDDLRNITGDQVAEVYKNLFWNKIQGDKINSDSIAALIFDWVANSGTGKIKNVQGILGLRETGKMNQETIDAINNYNTQKALFEKIWKYRYDFYHRIVEKNPNKGKYLKGWLNRLESYKFDD